MNGLEILIHGGQTAFAPGDTLEGSIRWQVAGRVQGLRLQLLWYTSGKGTTDIGLIQCLEYPTQQSSGSEVFRFTLPDGPGSFSGQLISLRWALELVSEPSSESCRAEFVLSETGQEIILPSLPPDSSVPGSSRLYNRLKPQ